MPSSVDPQTDKFLIKTPAKVENWELFKNLFSTEINQNERLSYNLVMKILYSKRLLVDHVDALEQCLAAFINEPPHRAEIFTFLNTSLIVSSTILQKFITPRSLKFTVLPFSLFTSGFCCFYFIKKISDFRIKYIERDLERMINEIDKFGNCIKRNITYFNEILVMKASELIESRQCERAWDCITAIKEVIDILYDATRTLEENYKIPARFRQYYYPMEELRDSEYYKNNVTDYSPKNIRDFYNIFAYVQSQFLLRLAFNISQDSKMKFLRNEVPEIESLIRQHVNEEEEHFLNLTYEMKRKQLAEVAMLHYQQAHQIKSGPVSVLRDTSLKLSACIIAIAEECQKLDLVLHKVGELDEMPPKRKLLNEDGEYLLEVANSMRSIENSLAICCDDFNRLMLVYNKFLASRLHESGTPKAIKHLPTEKSDESEKEDKIQSPLEEEKKDDFYAYMFDENLDRNKLVKHKDKDYLDFELINLDEKITKKKFKPVLRQLKSKIDPIRAEMLEKERKVLQLKGINLDNLLETENSLLSSNQFGRSSEDGDDENSSDGSIDEVEKEAKLHKTDQFQEMREFLAQKQAINIFNNVDQNREKRITEEILE